MMDFFMELIFEILLEGVCHLTVKNQRIKLWVRTGFFIVFTQIFTVLFAIGAVSLHSSGDGAWYVMAGLAAAWGIGMLIAAIYGHRKGWPKNKV